MVADVCAGNPLGCVYRGCCGGISGSARESPDQSRFVNAGSVPGIGELDDGRDFMACPHPPGGSGGDGRGPKTRGAFCRYPGGRPGCLEAYRNGMAGSAGKLVVSAPVARRGAMSGNRRRFATGKNRWKNSVLVAALAGLPWAIRWPPVAVGESGRRRSMADERTGHCLECPVSVLRIRDGRVGPDPGGALLPRESYRFRNGRWRRPEPHRLLRRQGLRPDHPVFRPPRRRLRELPPCR